MKKVINYLVESIQTLNMEATQEKYKGNLERALEIQDKIIELHEELFQELIK